MTLRNCHFCNELITKLSGQDSDSLCNHHITYIPEVVVPTHKNCHQKYHNTHPEHPKNPEIECRRRFIESNIMCHFCGEEITKKSGKGSGSLTIHSLDGNHSNWDPSNKVPAHNGCHGPFHKKGDKNPMKDPRVKAKHLKSVRTPEYRARVGEQWAGNKNPMKDPDIAKKVWPTRRERYGLTGLKPLTSEEKEKDHQKRSEATTRGTQTRRERGTKPNDNKKAWVTRRKRYGPSGRR